MPWSGKERGMVCTSEADRRESWRDAWAEFKDKGAK